MAQLIFDKKRFSEKLKSYHELFEIYYPCKVNSSQEIISCINEVGDFFETDSLEMIHYLIKDFHVSPDRILYNYLIRSKEQIYEAVELGVRRFAVDSMDNVEQIEEYGKDFLYLIRLSIKNILAQEFNGKLFDKWGTDIDSAHKIVEYIKTRTGSDLLGISFYYPKEYNTYDRLLKTIEIIKDEFCYLEDLSIDVGGGISLEQANRIAYTFKGQNIKFLIEPGRHLVGDCFNCICRVVDVKERFGKKYAFLDVGIYSGFIDTILKNHRFEFSLVEEHSKPVGLTEEIVLCGCTSDISDTFGIYEFPVGTINQGTHLSINNCGAYCPEMYMRFAGHQLGKIIIK